MIDRCIPLSSWGRTRLGNYKMGIGYAAMGREEAEVGFEAGVLDIDINRINMHIDYVWAIIKAAIIHDMYITPRHS